MKDSVFLKRMRDILVDQGKWIKDSFYRDSDWFSMQEDWGICLMGGVAYVGLKDGKEEVRKFQWGRSNPELKAAKEWPTPTRYIAEAIKELYPDRYGTARAARTIVMQFNDHEDTELEEVEQVLILARKKALDAG